MRTVKSFKNLYSTFLLLSLTLMLSACATFKPGFESPKLELLALRPVENSGLSQNFEIKLKVTNPNSFDLNLKGISYVLALQGTEILSGVSNQLPTLAAYSEESITLNTSVNLLNGMSFLMGLLKTPSDELSYTLKAKLNVAEIMLPVVINRDGMINLSGGRKVFSF